MDSGHANTQGFLLGEVARRITGKTLGTYLREEIAGPAGLDFFIGFGPGLDGRCADVVPPPPSPEADAWTRQLSVNPASLSGLALMRLHAYRNPPSFPGWGSSIRGAGARPKCRQPTATAMRAGWRDSSRRSPVTASWMVARTSPCQRFAGALTSVHA